jgi:DNA-binding CsgD family transcriptional regulator/PAS domain-containing protein
LKITEQTYDRLVGKIYDCAANPSLWPDALESFRKTLGAAYILVGLTDASMSPRNSDPTFNYWSTVWDKYWIDTLIPRMQFIPRIETLYESEIDTVWLQLDSISESEFQTSSFYTDWVRPQGLYDTCNIVTMRREKMIGMFTAPIFKDRPRYSADEVALMARLAPHIRRSIAIGDMVDKGKFSVTLYQRLLDSLNVAVILLGQGQRIFYANAAAELLFEDATLVMNVSCQLHATRRDSQIALTDSLARSANGDQAVGISGIGIPLFSQDGEHAAAYILPLGKSDVRNEIGQGHTAIFITKRQEQQPASIEILRTIFNLTQAEAKSVFLLVQGQTPTEIATALHVSIHTIRTHLSNCYAKTRTTDQGNLIALVNRLLPPLVS